MTVSANSVYPSTANNISYTIKEMQLGLRVVRYFSLDNWNIITDYFNGGSFIFLYFYKEVNFQLTDEAVELYNSYIPNWALKLKTPNKIHLQKIPATEATGI